MNSQRIRGSVSSWREHEWNFNPSSSCWDNLLKTSDVMVSDGQSGGQIDQPSMSHVTSIANKCSLISVKTSSTFTSFRLLTIKAYHEKGLDVPIELQGYFNVKCTVCPRSVEFHWHKFNSLKKKEAKWKWLDLVCPKYFPYSIQQPFSSHWWASESLLFEKKLIYVLVIYKASYFI